MSTISKLFSIKKKSEINNVEPENEIDVVKTRITYYQSGYAASIKASGSSTMLKYCLQNVYSNFEEECRKLKNEQTTLKQPYIENKKKLESELRNLETLVEITEEKINTENNKIECINKEIDELKSNPENHIEIKSSKPHALFYIGIFLLIPISIYLYVFYISATYSALFKTFDNDSLSTAIFDAQALSNAIKESWLEGILVVTIPTVFLGLGYIIHMFQKEKSIVTYFKLASLFIVTFLFDALLAYQIENKIYDFTKTPTSPEFNLKIAFTHPEFWMIIFAGFIVYIIWGLVFDFVMKEYEYIDKINLFIKNKNEEKNRLILLKEELTNEINNTKKLISSTKGSIEELQNKIDGFILPIKQYLHYHNQYTEGWFQAIHAELAISESRQREILLSCEEVVTEHLNALDLNKPTHQHIIYSRVS